MERGKMKQSEDRKKPSGERRRSAILEVALVGIAVFLGVVAAAVAVAQANVIVPKLGDIVWFRPGTDIPALLGGTAIAAQVVDPQGHPAKSCALLPTAMSAQGGSLVVEAERSVGGQLAYLVHWAGSRTSTGADDCGARADLLLSRADVENLARIAGGFGLEEKLIPPLFGSHAPIVTN